MKEKNLYIGCGPDIREGFLHSDIRKMEHIDYVCNAWDISKQIQDINHIYSRHMLEHLTVDEAMLTLKDWFKALKNGGTIRLIVPDLDFHCKQWLEAEWDDDTVSDKWSDATHSLASIYGWQKECDPTKDDYNTSYWDVHKSGYNKKRMLFLLKKIGFINIDIEVKNKWHLVANAQKSSED